jgi:hypothetical protein
MFPLDTVNGQMSDCVLFASLVADCAQVGFESYAAPSKSSGSSSGSCNAVGVRMIWA